MNLKDIIFSLFKYKSPEKHNFVLLEDDESDKSSNSSQSIKNDTNIPETKNIFPALSVNLEYVKTKYNSMINSDIIIREFTLNARGKQYSAFILYIDGMINTDIMNKFILEPLMLKNRSNMFDGEQNRIISEAVTNNITVRKVKKFDLSEYILGCLMPQNSVEQYSEFEKIFNDINSGNCALFIDTLTIAFDIDVKGFKQRSVERPQNEIVINGAHEAFVENIRTNTSLLRRNVHNENLIIENISIGKITKTPSALCYVQNIANSDLVDEVRYRLNNIEVDSLLSTGQLEQLIIDSNIMDIPQVLSTERPDKASGYLLDGRIIVLVNGTPYALIAPAIFTDFLASPDDKNMKSSFANFVKSIRILAAFFTLLLPGIYVAVSNFHSEVLPTDLLFSILASRENVPFPVIFEILILEISFELIREAGLRVPSPIGTTISIVGALVLGQAAVSAGIVSPVLVIVVAMTGISSFAIPDFSFSFHLRLYRFIFMFLGYCCGFLGISLGLFAYISILCDMKSFGVPYMANISPWSKIKGDSYFLPPIWKREYRAQYLDTKKDKKQEKIAMKWKFPFLSEKEEEIKR